MPRFHAMAHDGYAVTPQGLAEVLASMRFRAVTALDLSALAQALNEAQL